MSFTKICQNLPHGGSASPLDKLLRRRPQSYHQWDEHIFVLQLIYGSGIQNSVDSLVVDHSTGWYHFDAVLLHHPIHTKQLYLT